MKTKNEPNQTKAEDPTLKSIHILNVKPQGIKTNEEFIFMKARRMDGISLLICAERSAYRMLQQPISHKVIFKESRSLFHITWFIVCECAYVRRFHYPMDWLALASITNWGMGEISGKNRERPRSHTIHTNRTKDYAQKKTIGQRQRPSEERARDKATINILGVLCVMNIIPLDVYVPELNIAIFVCVFALAFTL